MTMFSMFSKQKSQKKNSRQKKEGGGTGQLLCLILYTSVTWWFFIYMICTGSVSGRMPRFVAIAALLALWVFIPGCLYRSFGAGRVIVLRLLMPVVYQGFFNILILLLILLQQGTGSILFRVGAILTICSIVVFMTDLISCLYHFFRFAGSKRKKEEPDSANPMPDNEQMLSENMKWAELPDGILRQHTRIFAPVWLVGSLGILLLVVHIFHPENVLTGGMSMPFLLLIFLCMIFVLLVMAKISYHIQVLFSGRDKYVLKRFDDREKNRE